MPFGHSGLLKEKEERMDFTNILKQVTFRLLFYNQCLFTHQQLPEYAGSGKRWALLLGTLQIERSFLSEKIYSFSWKSSSQNAVEALPTELESSEDTLSGVGLSLEYSSHSCKVAWKHTGCCFHSPGNHLRLAEIKKCMYFNYETYLIFILLWWNFVCPSLLTPTSTPVPKTYVLVPGCLPVVIAAFSLLRVPSGCCWNLSSSVIRYWRSW